MIRNILLDLDDTLLDFGVAEHAALMHPFVDFGIPAVEAVMRRYSQINSNCWRRLERGEISRSEVLIGRFRALFAEMALPGRAEEVNARYEEYLAREHAFVPGAPALLEVLYGKYRLYIVSNGTAKIQYSRIAGADIGKYFDGIFISEEIGYDKPDRAFLSYCFSQIPDFILEESVILGDSLTSDIQGGANAGLDTCWFNPNHTENPGKVIPTYEIASLEELYPLVMEQDELANVGLKNRRHQC